MKTFSGVLVINWGEFFKVMRILDKLVERGFLKDYTSHWFLTKPWFEIHSIDEFGINVLKDFGYTIPIRPKSYLTNMND